MRSGEVRLSPAHLRHLLHKLNQSVIRSKHKSIDHHPSAFAPRNLFQSLAHNQRIQPKGVLINPAIFERERRWFAISNHDDLLHVLTLAVENALRHAQALARVGVIRTNFYTREL